MIRESRLWERRWMIGEILCPILRMIGREWEFEAIFQTLFIPSFSLSWNENSIPANARRGFNESSVCSWTVRTRRMLTPWRLVKSCLKFDDLEVCGSFPWRFDFDTCAHIYIYIYLCFMKLLNFFLIFLLTFSFFLLFFFFFKRNVLELELELEKTKKSSGFVLYIRIDESRRINRTNLENSRKKERKRKGGKSCKYILKLER